MALDPAFLQQCQHLAHALEGCRGEDVCRELGEVRRSGVFANYEEPLPQPLKQRADPFQRPAWARREHKKLPRPREVGIPEHWRGDIALPAARMLLRDTARHAGTDSAR